MNITRRSLLLGTSALAVASAPSSLFGAPAPLVAATSTSTATTSSTIKRPILIGTTIESGIFKNLALSLISLQSTAGYAYPAILDENGYPTSTPQYNIYGVIKIPSNITPSTRMVLKWTGAGTIQLARGAPGFTVVAGSPFVSGSAAYNLTATGTNARVVFSFATSVPSTVSFIFPAGKTFQNLANVVLCRLSDESAIDQATTPEQMIDDNFVALYQVLNPGTVRPMGWANPNYGNVSQLKYVAPWKTSIGVSTQRWVPRAWAGVTSGTDTYTCAAQKDATSSYVNGEMIQLQFASANTSASVTIDSGGRGAVRVLSASCRPLAVGQIGANSLATLTYDALLGAFLWQKDGQTACIPYEFQVAFANRINANFWCTIPAYFDDASVTALTKLVRDKLSSSLSAYFEYGNEIWNWMFPPALWAAARGAALGFPTDNNRQIYGWYGLRVRQVMGLATAAWAPRSTAQLKRVMAFQAFGPLASTNTYRFQGADLSGAKYPTYKAKGFQDYNAAPNRPIDYCDVLSYATYYSGAQCTNFDATYVSNGAASIADLLAAADDYATAVPTKMSSALAFLDNDIRAGKLSGSGKAGSQTLLALRSTAQGVGIYPAWEAVAKTFSKAVVCYEGGHESWYPSIQTCTTLGISTSYGGPTGKIALLLQGYKLSDAFTTLAWDQISQFMSQPHSQGAAWLLISGTNQWGLSTADCYAAKFKSWNALATFKQ